MKVLLNGIGGHMGHEVAELCKANFKGAELVLGIDPNLKESHYPFVSKLEDISVDGDVLIDFSHHSCTSALCSYAVKNSIPLVIATTGQTNEEKKTIEDAAKAVPVFFAANYSLGIALLIELAKKTVAVMPEAEIEIIEKHHNRKIDAPSGTALAIAHAIEEVRPELKENCGRAGMKKREENEIGIHAIRMGNIVGDHEVIVGTPNQTITLKHEAHSRALFAEGALAAAQFVIGKEPGLYDMKSLIEF